MRNNRYIVANYTLHTVEDGGEKLVEATTEQRPFAFVSGMGMVLDALEETLEPLPAGEQFDLTLTPDRAFGERNDDNRHTLDKSLFYHDGEFDSENIYEGAVVKMNDGHGNVFDAKVVAVDDKSVTMEIDVDLNHPLAGKTLHFRGSVVTNREATDEEVAKIKQMLNGGGCGGHCGGGCGHCEDGGCGNCGGDDCGGCGGECGNKQ